MLTYEMLTGFPPWYCRDRKKLIRRLKYSPLKIPSSFSPIVASFCEELLIRSPSKRLGEEGGGGGSTKLQAFSPRLLLIVFLPLPLSSSTLPSGGYGDGTQVKSHKFFDGVKWDNVLAKKITPPIKPCDSLPVDSLCVENFEKEFTSLDVASAFKVTEPLSPSSAAIFTNFSLQPAMRFPKVVKSLEEEGGVNKGEGKEEEMRPPVLAAA